MINRTNEFLSAMPQEKKKGSLECRNMLIKIMSKNFKLHTLEREDVNFLFALLFLLMVGISIACPVFFVMFGSCGSYSTPLS
jgi:hypothetical protein